MTWGRSNESLVDRPAAGGVTHATRRAYLEECQRWQRPTDPSASASIPRLTPMPCPPPWRVHGGDTRGLPDLGGWSCWQRLVTRRVMYRRGVLLLRRCCHQRVMSCTDRHGRWQVASNTDAYPDKACKTGYRLTCLYNRPPIALHANACLTNPSHVTLRSSPLVVPVDWTSVTRVPRAAKDIKMLILLDDLLLVLCSFSLLLVASAHDGRLNRHPGHSTHQVVHPLVPLPEECPRAHPPAPHPGARSRHALHGQWRLRLLALSQAPRRVVLCSPRFCQGAQGRRGGRVFEAVPFRVQVMGQHGEHWARSKTWWSWLMPSPVLL